MKDAIARRQSTRDRIVEAARVLFNEQGYELVTTAALAAHLGIAEGNLWYHFKTKRALLDALAARYADVIEARLLLAPASDAVASYVRLLETLMSEFRAFRFLYRDQRGYGELADQIAQNAPRWLEMTVAQIEAHLAALVAAGLLDRPREHLRDVAINATIILRYGLEHYRELGVPVGQGSGAVQRTLKRHLTLFEHQLDPNAAAHLNAALAAIEAEVLAA
jgi:AcrR family transcriptional regulator